MKRLLLAGGGHAHVEVLRVLGAEPPPDTEITVVNPGRYAPYSGMLPGLIAGHYPFEACHIDLQALAQRAGARWIDAHAQSLDPAQRKLTLADGVVLDYDLLSINSGSVPGVFGVPGVVQHAIAVKPVAAFLAAWDTLRARVRAGEIGAIAVVGGGAAGVEVVAAMHHCITQNVAPRHVRFHLITDTPHLLPRHPGGVRRTIARSFARKGIEVHIDMRVTCVTAEAVMVGERRIAADAVVWVTGAAPPAWLVHTGLARDAQGFLTTNAYLQSASHGNVFAAGDCATIAGRVYPKSGVYAVRQGPVLARNLLCALRDEALMPYSPQPRALALISTGGQHAIASWGALAWHGNWVWRWKDRIDREFMAKYRC